MLQTFLRGCSALALALCATPALADDAGPRPDGHAPAGVMNDHLHKGGEIMVGLRLSRERSAGSNLAGSDTISDAAVIAAGYTSRTEAMTMDMAMLELMYAPSDRLTLMVMPQYMRMDMTTLGLAPSSHGGHGGHALAPGQTHEHASEGLGDTQLSASYGLLMRPDLKVHATLGVSVPTGDVGLKDADGNYLHYGMQPGSGTWDLSPMLTVNGKRGALGWGAQASYLWRTSDHNASGFAFGDKVQVSGWLSHLVGERVSLSGRLSYLSEGSIKGHYNAGHNHASPPDRQGNYGGERVSAGAGVNVLLPSLAEKPPRLGLELQGPLWQRVNGIQPPQKWALAVSLGQAF